MPKESISLHLRLVALIPAYDIPKDATFIITKKSKALLYTPVTSFTKDGKRFNQFQVHGSVHRCNNLNKNAN